MMKSISSIVALCVGISLIGISVFQLFIDPYRGDHFIDSPTNFAGDLYCITNLALILIGVLLGVFRDKCNPSKLIKQIRKDRDSWRAHRPSPNRRATVFEKLLDLVIIPLGFVFYIFSEGGALLVVVPLAVLFYIHGFAYERKVNELIGEFPSWAYWYNTNNVEMDRWNYPYHKDIQPLNAKCFVYIQTKYAWDSPDERMGGGFNNIITWHKDSGSLAFPKSLPNEFQPAQYIVFIKVITHSHGTGYDIVRLQHDPLNPIFGKMKEVSRSAETESDPNTWMVNIIRKDTHECIASRETDNQFTPRLWLEKLHLTTSQFATNR